MKNQLLLLAATTTCVLVASETASASASIAAGQDVVIETIGDTTVVRTLSGSVWEGTATLVPEVSMGELDGPDELLFGWIRSIAVDDDHNVYAFDDQAQAVRVFDSAGRYVETLGRRGRGPGEFSRAESIATLPDGRLVVRDPGNAALEVFVPGTTETERWRYNVGGLHSLTPLYTDASGRTYLHTTDLSRTDFTMHIVVFGPDGTQIDTLPEPSSTYEPPEVTAERGASSVGYYVPFSPELYWTIHPSGHFLSGVSTEYKIDLARDDGVLRIERAANPVPVHEEELARQRESVVQRMRAFAPGWTWDGPPIPDHKPLFGDLVAGRDGRIWVAVPTEARAVENPNHDPEDPSSAPVVWRAPPRYDVFEPDGTYLGAVMPPAGFTGSTQPVFDGDYVWAVTRDELGVQRVVRFRIVVGG
ncbi:MAG: 6-bladed beta-propeller [Gemmatimonadetes bacterium]|nr:6-bladed beta-propeller [Gemmatimonadota bacterium]MYI66467.1 6-bladed beta-propeller [Gemmatimonadota bacterium]